MPTRLVVTTVGARLAGRVGAACALGVAGVTVSPALAADAAGSPGVPVAHVVVVGAPGLRWDDVSPSTTPVLWGLADGASLGAASVRSEGGATRRADGWLTLGSGDRARAFPASTDPVVAARSLPDPADAGQLAGVVALNRRSTFAAEVGALGTALHRAGRRTAVVGGAGAALGAMDATGSVDAHAASVAEALGSADVVVDELPGGYDPLPGAARTASVHALDAQLGTVASALGPADLLLVVGVSDRSEGSSRLTLALARGPGFDRRWLASASTRHQPLVQLVDVAPTVLAVLDVAAPSTMVGGAWRSAGPAASGTGGPAAVETLQALTARTWAQSRLGSWFTRIFDGFVILFAATVAVVWWRGADPPWLRPAALTVAALPVSAWLVQLLPWWRWGTWTVGPLILAWAIAVGQLALRGPWRRQPWGPAGAVGLVSAGLIALDVATGSRLQLDAPFGDNPVVAGRFHGVGNGAFAVLAAGALVLATALSAARHRLAAIGVVLGVGLLAVAVDGSPALGDDLGGVLSLVPALLLLAVLVVGARVRPLYALAVLAGAAALAVALALYDYSLPASRRSHLGRFVQQVRDGTAGGIVHRKLVAAERTLASGWSRWVVLAALALVVLGWLLARRQRLAALDGEQGRLVALLAALGLLGLLGASLNDSGLAITSLAWTLGGPLGVLVLVARPRTVALATPEPAVGPDDHAERAPDRVPGDRRPAG